MTLSLLFQLLLEKCPPANLFSTSLGSWGCLPNACAVGKVAMVRAMLQHLERNRKEDEYLSFEESAKFSEAVLLAASRGFSGVLDVAISRPEFDVNARYIYVHKTAFTVCANFEESLNGLKNSWSFSYIV